MSNITLSVPGLNNIKRIWNASKVSVSPAVAETLRIAIIVLAAGFIYQHTLHSPFVFDDIGNIIANPHIKITEISPAKLIKAGFESPIPSRPVANISFALNYRVHRLDPVGYHLVNLFFHIASGLLLYFLFKTTLRLILADARNRPIAATAFLAALIWLVHPVQTQSVNYIVQRMTGMSAFFYIGALYLYVQARCNQLPSHRRVLYAAAFVSGVLAVGSKENAITLPFFIALYEWYFFQKSDPAWLKRMLRIAALILVAVLPLVFLYMKSHYTAANGILAGYEKVDFTLGQRLLTEFRVVVHYMGLLVYPHPDRLVLDYDFPLSYALFDPPTTFFAILAVAGLAGLAIFLIKRNALLSFAILWFIGNLVIESSVIALDLVFEHRLYLPTMFLPLAGVWAAFRPVKSRLAVGASIALIVLGLCFWTMQRNQAWQDEISLWQDTVDKAPGNARAHNNLGLAYFEQGNIPEAIRHYQAAIALDPKYDKPHTNLGKAFAAMDRLEEAEDHLRTSVRLKPDNHVAHSNLGVLYLKQNRLDSAVTSLTLAVDLAPEYVYAHNHLGVALAGQGRIREAIEHFKRALDLDPGYAEVYNNLGALMLQIERKNEAGVFFRRALELRPDYPEARQNLDRLSTAAGGGDRGKDSK